MEPTCLTHIELADTLRTLVPGVDASDLHGSLSGYLCGGGDAGADDWLDALQIDTDSAESARHRILQRLYRECRAQFAAVPASVDPLLPSPAAGPRRRGDALVEWCRGFLGGVGLSAAMARTGLSAEAREILDDFGTIAASRLEYAEARDDEQALDEVLAFVRTGAAMLHRELSRRAAPLH